MEVLTELDRGRIESLLARDEFFWLDLNAPSGADLDAAGELLGLHRLALEDTREFGQRPKLDRYRQVDDLAALTSMFFNANANRLNRLATRLTVIATFFLIWTLVTSFFGQNFGWLVRHIDSLEAFLIYDGIGLLLPTIVAAVIFWRRRREWL
jgi:Mg2+ and Co2+ transporter CorA